MSFKEISKATNIKEFKAAIKSTKNVAVAEAETIDKDITYTPSLPKVNVVPSIVFEKYQVKGIARKFLLIGAGIAGVFGLALIAGTAYIGVGNAELDKLVEEQSTITAEVNQLQPYDLYKLSIDGKRTVLYSSVQKDINMGGIYANVNSASISNSVDIRNAAVKQYAEGEEGASCINPDPFGDSAGIIGCIQLSGSGPDKDAVNGFLRELEDSNASNLSYKNPFISSFTTSSGSSSGSETNAVTSTFTATIAFTQQLYTNQYASLALTLDELIATSGPAPEAEEETPAPNNAGYAGQQALALVPALTSDETLNIDSIAISVCNTPESERTATATAASDAVKTIIENGRPDIEATTITADLMDAITNNCTSVINN